MTNDAPGTQHAGSAQALGDALRRMVARDAGAIEIELMVQRRWRAFLAAELWRGLAGAGGLLASASRRLAAASRQWRHTAPALLLCLVFGYFPARAAPEAEAIMLLAVGEGAHGVLSVPMRTDTLGGPAVVVVHDSLGRDSRADRYVVQLLERGFTVLEIEVFPTIVDGVVTLPRPDDVEAATRVTAAADALVADTGVHPGAIGALGFGAGARAVLLAAAGATGRDPFVARTLLYPGCELLRQEIAGPDGAVLRPSAAPRGHVLLLHGGRDPANTQAACGALAAEIAAVAAVRHLVMPQAGRAWDFVAAGAITGPTLLPIGGPDDGRLAADPWDDATRFAADTVSTFLAAVLHGAMTGARHR
jgi:dienelactone hydrolase